MWNWTYDISMLLKNYWKFDQNTKISLQIDFHKFIYHLHQKTPETKIEIENSAVNKYFYVIAVENLFQHDRFTTKCKIFKMLKCFLKLVLNEILQLIMTRLNRLQRFDNGSKIFPQNSIICSAQVE